MKDKISNVKAQITNQILSQNNKRKYDLEERTAKVGKNIIDFLKSLAKNEINRPLISQIVWREAQELT